MPRTTRSVGFAALFALQVCALTVTIAGCGGKKPTREQVIERYSQELRDAVSNNVPDEQRRQHMLVIADQLKVVHLRFNQETVEFIESYRKLNADYDSTRPAFEQLFSDYSAKRVKARSEALDLHFKLAALATAAEWETLGRAETKLYDKFTEARPPKENMK